MLVLKIPVILLVFQRLLYFICLLNFVYVWLYSVEYWYAPLLPIVLRIHMQVGFVNSLVFAKSARFLVAGVGQVIRFLIFFHLPTGKNFVEFNVYPFESVHAPSTESHFESIKSCSSNTWSGKYIVLNQEPRLGRWGRVSSARNGVAIHPIKLKDEHSSIAWTKILQPYRILQSGQDEQVPHVEDVSDISFLVLTYSFWQGNYSNILGGLITRLCLT